ncbi:hypothetical protein B224_2981 [Aeromonas media WS]|nr:hypothetical protein B224_2981 [Aeromonas media WS]
MMEAALRSQVATGFRVMYSLRQPSESCFDRMLFKQKPAI